MSRHIGENASQKADGEHTMSRQVEQNPNLGVDGEHMMHGRFKGTQVQRPMANTQMSRRIEENQTRGPRRTQVSRRIEESASQEADGEHTDAKTDWRERQSRGQRKSQDRSDRTSVQRPMANAQCPDGLERGPQRPMTNSRMSRQSGENASLEVDSRCPVGSESTSVQR
jgi:hypothetical protein